MANQSVVFGVRDISAESIGLDVKGGALRLGMQFSIYVFCGEIPVASNLRVQVVSYGQGYAKCRYVDLTQGQSKSLQKIVTRGYVSGAPLRRRRNYMY
ncbi:hypothetical protein [Salidesulfovibrio onnuriiensis]|uniref:hypothetical protein n=1 Tax=Salidesulfovibrio onnuriiensis TaxID=2583823 RepID=UPI0011C70729|nr:hypothetical protein [Salidesulfovibrio onnuriiensis]